MGLPCQPIFTSSLAKLSTDGSTAHDDAEKSRLTQARKDKSRFKKKTRLKKERRRDPIKVLSFPCDEYVKRGVNTFGKNLQ
jgi:hypothetical protein